MDPSDVGMSRQPYALTSIKQMSSPANPLEDSLCASRSSLTASPSMSSITSRQSSRSISGNDWEVFPWDRFPGLTISERRGRPKSWIWQHGYDLQEIKDETRYRWVCHECVRKKDPKVTAHLASATANIETHLNNQHHIFGGKTRTRQPKKRTVVQMLSQQADISAASNVNFIESLKKQFDKDIFQRKLVRWIVETN